MKFLERYTELGIFSPTEVFPYLASSFRASIKSWDYFVNWEKAYTNAATLRRELHLWNSLLGSKSFDDEFLDLLTEYPEIVRTIPALIVRDGSKSNEFDLVEDQSARILRMEHFNFSIPADSEELRQLALRFVVKTGLRTLFVESGVTNLIDYMVGVETGLDSNGRKNRSGFAMEFIVQNQIQRIAEQSGYQWISQARANQIRNEFGFEVRSDKSTRSFDFALTDGRSLLLIETNFYGAGGSKLKSVAGEFAQLSELVSSDAVSLVWITDGPGWRTALAPLEDAHQKIDFVFNLEMVGLGLLEAAIREQ